MTFDPNQVLHVACGSPHYAAPEMLLGGGYLGQRIDMWSLGVCLYAMVCGCLPFDEPEVDVLYDRIIAGDYDFSPNPTLSSEAKQLIRGLLHMPPEQRLTSRAVLSHRWLRASGARTAPHHTRALTPTLVTCLGLATGTGAPSHSAERPSSGPTPDPIQVLWRRPR